MPPELHVPRRADAERLASLLSPDPILGESAGIFLAAPRRTGKSTFLRRDLLPLLKERETIGLYVDLWADRAANPGDAIIATLRDALETRASAITKMKRALPVKGLGAFGFSVDLGEGKAWSGTIADALAALTTATGKDVVLIVDEAQHALETQEGLDAMFALKAARDAVNQSPTEPRLYLIMTGSHRDKLAALVHDQQAPFFGARIRDFPPLGQEYPAALAERINASLAPEAQLSAEDLDGAFDLLGRRPEMLSSCLRDLLFAPEGAGPKALMRLAQERKKETETAALSEYSTMSALQKAILKVMAADGISFAPYSEDTRAALAAETNGRKPSTSAIQKALNTLRERGFVWRPAYGQYILDNADIALALSRSAVP